jgi:hypothetical protein
MKTLSNIEDALYDLATLVLPGVRVIWMHENGPRPSLPYVVMHMMSLKSIGIDVYQNDEIIGNRDFTLMCQSFGKHAMEYLEAIKISFEKPSTQIYLRANGIVFRESHGINDISEVVDVRFEERAQIDFILGFAQTDSDILDKIEHVNLEKDFFAQDLNTITVEHVTI